MKKKLSKGRKCKECGKLHGFHIAPHKLFKFPYCSVKCRSAAYRKLSDNDKLRRTPAYFNWRKNVLERDDNTCFVTGIKCRRLHVHHLESFADNPDLRFIENNGITLSVRIHKLFHKIYGKGGNTRAQFIEFCENYKKNERLVRW